MSWYALASFCAVYFAAVATPGPGVAAVVAQSLARGPAGAPAFIAGFIVGDLTWFMAAALGLSALAQAAHGALVLLKFGGAAYLLYLAFRLWTAPSRPLAAMDAGEPRLSSGRLFLGSLTLTLGNPKPMVFYLALLPTFVPLEHLGWAGYLEIAAAIAVILPATLCVYVLLASQARDWFRSPRGGRIVNRGSGALMAAAAVAVATR